LLLWKIKGRYRIEIAKKELKIYGFPRQVDCGPYILKSELDSLRYGKEISDYNGVTINVSKCDGSILEIITKSFKNNSKVLWTFPNELFTYSKIDIWHASFRVCEINWI